MDYAKRQRRHAVLWAMILVAAALAGCAEPEEQVDDNETDDGMDGMDGTDGTDDGEATITSVTITEAPETAQPGSAVTVCWHVDGTGNIPHTAVHWDTESHEGENVTFQDYDGGATYPDNETAEAEGGYDLPGDFCSAFDMPATAGTVYYRAHAMITPPGVVSDEASTTAGLT